MPNTHSILIVEDDAAIRDVFGEFLRSEGHAVSLAGNGAEAMELLRGGFEPCLIFIDLLMPVLDGWGLAAQLGRVPRLASIPFVILSAQPSAGSRATPIGARARLTKPISLGALLEVVEQHCGIPEVTGSMIAAARRE